MVVAKFRFGIPWEAESISLIIFVAMADPSDSVRSFD